MDRANGAAAAAAGRAERFEDEKRRIIESCFSKKEPDGSLLETYITHIRITEFSSHPTSPPPPPALTPDSEKPRIIIVAVRKSGRVRMHKSKENSNNSFSIGKTWNLDDLSHIESYTGPQVPQNLKEWASNTGFLVTLGKPYYWQAQTDKEKKFFIASLIKIYGKYTGGKAPELIGFDPKELDQVLGAGKRPAAGTSTPPARALPSADQTPNNHQSNLSAASAGIAPEPHKNQRPSPGRSPVRSPVPSPLGGSPAGSIDVTGRDQRPRTRLAQGGNKSQESMGSRIEDDASLPPRSRNGITGSAPFGRFGEPRETSSDVGQESPRPPSQPKTGNGPPPQRKRPPMDPSRPLDRDLVPPPLMGSNPKRDPMAPPPRSVDRVLQKKQSLTQTGLQSETSSLTGSMLDRELTSPPMNSIENMRTESNRSDAGSVRAPTIPSTSNTRSSSPTARTEDPVFIDGPAPPVPAIPAETANTEEARPGLGSMIKSKKSKNDLAGALWKAASAATAFKPRPGGAAERFKQMQSKTFDGGADSVGAEPDGITGVVPARPKPIPVEQEKPVTQEEKPPEIPARGSLVPAVKVSVPHDQPGSSPGPPKEVAKKEEEPPEKAPRRSPHTANDAKYLRSLGIDPTLLDTKTEDFGQWLDYFGLVPGDQMRARSMEDIKADLERELNKAQAGGWLARFREEDERVDAIKKGLDLTMSECEELDNLLTLYSVELSTLSEDISYIEAQGQGLQVQAANQKLLKKELESLLETCAITQEDLQALSLAPFDNTHGLHDIETALVTLFRAMVKMDISAAAQQAPVDSGDVDADLPYGLDSDFSQMRVVQEKQTMYKKESFGFMRRLVAFMAGQFEDSFNETQRILDGALSKKVDPSHHNAGRDMLWKYNPLMLYARDADDKNWDRLLQIYQEKSAPLYKKEFQNVIVIWRRNARKLTGEEAELLFSYQQEKKEEGVATAARKMTVKRSVTLAKALRSPLADNSDRKDKSGRSMPYEVFAGVIGDLLPLVEMEQNFIVDFFHASSLEQLDFPDAVSTSAPKDRQVGDLKHHRVMEPDRERALRIKASMEKIFGFLGEELQRLLEWVIGQDPLQGVGVLVILEKKLADYGQSNQEYQSAMLQKLHDHLSDRFEKFVSLQILAIDDTKVKISKRKGVISFIRVFPTFSTAVENMMAGIDPNLGIRRTIDREYDRILRSMFEALTVIARENPAVSVVGGGTDPEDKETLNFHILLIENMNHFIEETDTRGLDILEEWKELANQRYQEHMDLYLAAAMRRPLGKLLEYLDNIETQLGSNRSPTSIAAQPSNSKNVFNKILGNYDSKEVKKGIDALKKRVEKHFGDADEPALSRGLVVKVLQECERFYAEVEGRIGRVTTDVYGGDVLFEWPRQDVKAAFR